MKIVRGRDADNFTTIPNRTARDNDISYRALGVLNRLLSNVTGYPMDSMSLAAGSGREGRDAIRTAIRELAAKRYMCREYHRSADGKRFVGSCWVVYSSPKPDNGEDDGSKKAERRVLRHSGDQAPLKSGPENQKSKKQKTKSSSTRVRATAAPAAAAHTPKSRKARPSGLVTFYTWDEDEAATLEAETDPDRLMAACVAVRATRKESVPGLVRNQLALMAAAEAKARRAAGGPLAQARARAEAHRNQSPEERARGAAAMAAAMAALNLVDAGGGDGGDGDSDD